MARSAGLHLEGPFLCPAKRGAHEERHLRLPLRMVSNEKGFAEKMSDEEIRSVVSNELGVPDVDWIGGEVRIMTLAPEMSGGLIVTRALSRAGVVVSLGHTAAGIKVADEAIESGATLITHLFNAMNMFHHRDPGLVGTLGRRPPTLPLPLPLLLNASPLLETLLAKGKDVATAVAAIVKPRTTAGSSPVSRAAERLTRVSFVSPFTRLPPPVTPLSMHVPLRSLGHIDDLAQMRHISLGKPALETSLAPPTAVSDTAAKSSGRSLSRDIGGSGTPMTPLGATQCAATWVNESVRNVAAAQWAETNLNSTVSLPYATPCALTVAPGDVVAASRPFYGLIADGVHVHPYAVSLAWETHPAGLILVTDAMNALGLPVGRHDLGGQSVDVFDGRSAGGCYDGRHAVIAGTDTLAGAVEPLPQCINNFMAFTKAPLAAALAAVTRHPAAAIGLSDTIGSLKVGAWADIVLLRVTRGGDDSVGLVAAAAKKEAGIRDNAMIVSEHIQVLQTWVGGVRGWTLGRDENSEGRRIATSVWGGATSLNK